MLERFKRTPRPSTVIACLALFFAVAGGSAIALQGRNSVDSGDIRRGQVKTADLADNAVTSRKIKPGAVRSADIADGQVAAADLAADEPWRRVGMAGQPAFGRGGDDDCLWANIAPLLPTTPLAFYKDSHGIVRMTGAVVASNGPGGDMTCDDVRDSIVFELPPGYRPTAAIQLYSGPYSIAIVGPQPFVTPSATFAPGSVAVNGPTGTPATLEGVTFRADSPNDGLARRTNEPVHLTAEQAEGLGFGG